MSETTPEARERFVDVHGVKTRYWEAGAGDPLVLVHGGGAGADAWGNWAGCFPAFSMNFRTIALDMIGYGGSISNDVDFVYSQAARISHLTGFLDALGLHKVSLAGNSMGGATSLGVAMRDPDRVERLILMGSAGVYQEPSSELQTILNYQEPSFEGMRRIVQALTHDHFQPSDEMVNYRYKLTTDDAVMRAYNSTMGLIRDAGTLYYDESDIAAVKVPTLVVSGREDAVVPLSSAVRFHQLLDNSWLHAIPHCGHWAMIERPGIFAAVTTRFLTDRLSE
ncbi:alpha/beta fold hydrolase [Nocardia sp. R6R-6]|uniref:alpha/beta fold hydrolase n=1 Tax=Nocardia sp. R6R-6 TaxID=3459303 RepID=UPI00403DA407